MALDIRKVQSKNEVKLTGVLKQLKIEEKRTNDGREYVQGVATVRVDQEINGKAITSEIPVKMYSMKYKKDGTTPNKVYGRIVGYQQNFISLSATDDPSKASRVTFGAQVTSFKENAYYDAKNNRFIEKGFAIEGNFLNNARDNEQECAEFEVTGVVVKTRDETDKEGNVTGRLEVDMALIGYKGEANVITLIAQDNAKAYIETNYQIGDTVTLTGDIIMSFTDELITEEQAFGKPKIKHHTNSIRELVINGGSPSTIDPERSYDHDDVKLVLQERMTKHEEMKNKPKKTDSNDFGF